MKPTHLLSLSVLLLILACGKAPELQEPQAQLPADPFRIDGPVSFEASDVRTFRSLPLEGDVRDGKRHWSGNDWPLRSGLINQRWNQSEPEGFDLISPGREEALFIHPMHLQYLSPAEKYDLLMGRYDYPLKKEVEARADRQAESWQGIMNGWAVASFKHQEPTPKVLVNPDGIAIPFGAADIKALVSYYYAFHRQVPVLASVGERCERNSTLFNPNPCGEAISAATFHLILTNQLGLRKEAFLMDVERYRETWYHPVVAFSARLTGEERPNRRNPAGVVRILKFRTTVTYVDKYKRPTWHPVNGTADQAEAFRNYSYHLFLNSRDEIVGGEWRSGVRPEVIWATSKFEVFQGLLENLRMLLNDEY